MKCAVAKSSLREVRASFKPALPKSEKCVICRSKKSMSEEGPVARFTYFDGRGHGQRVRYALAGRGIKWEESPLKLPGDMDAARPHCLFGQVPLLEIDGLKLVQSWAIVRYLGSKDLLSPGDAWRADAWGEEVRDFYSEAGFIGFGWSPDRTAAMQQVRRASDKFLPLFEAALTSSFTVGETPCWADHQLLFVLDYVVDVLGEKALCAYSKCSTLRTALRSTPHMQAFYESEFNKGLVDQKYMMEVRAAMSPKP